MVNEQEFTPPPGVSGKRVTLWVLVGLVVIGCGISYTLWTYDRLDQARKQTAASWRELTDQLAIRYRAAETLLIPASAEGEISSAADAQLRASIDAFFTTSLPKEQNTFAINVEQLLQRSEFSAAAARELSPSDELLKTVEAFNRDLEQQRALLNSPGGRILESFLDFTEQSQFQLAHYN